MIRWTSAGVVSAPTTLQIRVTRRHPERVRAGAPVPTRSLDDEEIRANIHHFTVGLGGPAQAGEPRRGRARPCDALVLSGVRLDELPGLDPILGESRGWGIHRVTVHLGAADLPSLVQGPLRGRIDVVAVPITGVADAEALLDLSGVGVAVHAVVLLDSPTLPKLDAIAARLAEVRPERVVFTWPFPPVGPPPPAGVVVAALPGPVEAILRRGLRCGVKGLPRCLLGDLGDHLGRSRNRWYVDAEHQVDDALLFFPDVVRFSKLDDCRFCAQSHRCDGAPEAWLRAGLVEGIRPIDPVC